MRVFVILLAFSAFQTVFNDYGKPPEFPPPSYRQIVKSKLGFLPFISASQFVGYDFKEFKKRDVKGVNLGFLGARSKGDCSPVWDGERDKNVDFEKSNITIQAADFNSGGGAVRCILVNSGGGAGAKLETTCKSHTELAKVYQQAMKATKSYHFGLCLCHLGGIRLEALENVAKAVAQLQTKNKNHTFSLLVPVNGTGLQDIGYNFLQFAAKYGLKVDTVNLMLANFVDKSRWGDLVGQVVKNADKQVHQIWGPAAEKHPLTRIGVTVQIGQNSKGKEFDMQDAKKVVKYATENKLGVLSFYSLGRDQRCKGHLPADDQAKNNAPDEQKDVYDDLEVRGQYNENCSGVKEQKYAFLKEFAKFAPVADPPFSPLAG